MSKLAFLGLGVMGFPMAGYLAKAGHQVTVYNRSPNKAEAWLDAYGDVGDIYSAPTPAGAAAEAEIVFACVSADADIKAVALGSNSDDGAFSSMTSGSLFVDHSTVSAETARILEAEAKTRGIDFVDAPVSGGQAGAENGTLTIMAGGAEAAYERAAPVMAAYGKQMRCLGPVGAGQLAKMVNQICIAGIVQGLSEALHFAECAGLDGKAVVDVIAAGAAGSWQMNNRAHTMLDGQFDFGFAVDLMRKDLNIVLSEARSVGVSLPLTALVDQYYGDVQRLGGGRWDTSSLITRLRAMDKTEIGG